jgi:hypothetical protein
MSSFIPEQITVADFISWILVASSSGDSIVFSIAGYRDILHKLCVVDFCWC